MRQMLTQAQTAGHYFTKVRSTPMSTLFPYTTLFRSLREDHVAHRLSARQAESGRGLDLAPWHRRSEEHTSELQSRGQLVCRLLLEKKNFPKNSRLPQLSAK